MQGILKAACAPRVCVDVWCSACTYMSMLHKASYMVVDGVRVEAAC
jgi:hypothetical protein